MLGVDVSRPMLDVARARATQEASRRHAVVRRCRRVRRRAAERPGPALFALRRDVLRPAFAGLHAPAPDRCEVGGRCVFVCWRAPSDNPWAMAPLVAARKALNVTPAPADPTAPGPFAFADDGRLRGILTDAGIPGHRRRPLRHAGRARPVAARGRRGLAAHRTDGTSRPRGRRAAFEHHPARRRECADPVRRVRRTRSADGLDLDRVGDERRLNAGSEGLDPSSAPIGRSF